MKARTVSFALLLAGSATAQFDGVAHEVLIPEGVGAVPYPTNSVRSMNGDSTVRINVEAWDNGRPMAGLERRCFGPEFVVLDNYEEVSDLESVVYVRSTPGSPRTLILIDLSSSLARQPNLDSYTKAAVVNFIQRLFAERSQTGLIHVAVYAFSGRWTSQRVHDWSSDETSLVNSVNALKCGDTTSGGGLLCGDTATELYGVLVWAAGHLTEALKASDSRHTARGPDGALVVFSEGIDLVDSTTAAQARRAIVDARVLVFALTVHVSDQTAQQQVLNLEAITGDKRAVFVAQAFRVSFGRTALTAGNLLREYYSRSYQITFCSARRGGLFTFDVRIRYYPDRYPDDPRLSPTMGFVTGQQVGWLDPRKQLQDREVFVLVDIREVRAQYPPVQYLFEIPLGFGIFSGSHLRHVYEAEWVPTCDVTWASLKGPCHRTSDRHHQFYSCTGGSEYDCGQQLRVGNDATCSCPLQLASKNAATVCNPADCRPLPQTQAPLPCHGLPAVPVAIQPGDFTALSSSRLSLAFRPTCQDGSGVGDLTFSPCDEYATLPFLSRTPPPLQPVFSEAVRD